MLEVSSNDNINVQLSSENNQCEIEILKYKYLKGWTSICVLRYLVTFPHW